jgi:multimeric flavodoxin WrbA
MRAFVVNGAQRKKGYTREVVDTFCLGLESGGAAVDRVDLGEVLVAPCRGCYSCWRPESPGRCVIRDDMGGLLDRYFASDVVAFATPLYFYSFSSLLKSFFERLFPLLDPPLELGQGSEMVHHALRYPGRGPKKTALIVVSGHRNEKILGGILPTFDLIARALHLEWVGTLFRPEAFFIDFAVGKERTLRKIMDAIERAGKALATRGEIGEELQAQSSMPLAKSFDAFREQSTVFWEVVQEGRRDIGDRDQIQRDILCDPRIVMPSVASCFDPGVAGDLTAVFNFHITDNLNGKWHLNVEGGRCEAVEGLHDAPDVTLTTTLNTLMNIFRLRLDARTAISKGDLLVEGNHRLLARFGRLFPNPSE